MKTRAGYPGIIPSMGGRGFQWTRRGHIPFFFSNNAGELRVIVSFIKKGKGTNGLQKRERLKAPPEHTRDYKKTCQVKGHNTTTTSPPLTTLKGQGPES